jgi:hypothetical protein
MLTTDDRENLKNSEERMMAAQKEHRAFIEQPNRTNSPEERAENRRLLDGLKRAIGEYEKALQKNALA